MTRLQRFVLWLFPEAEVDSRRWTFVCTACGQRSDVWEAGGIRYRASGRPTSLVRCPKCRARTFSQISREEDR